MLVASQSNSLLQTRELTLESDSQDSDDDMPLHKVAKRRIVESDSDED